MSTESAHSATPATPATPVTRGIADAILDFVGQVPASEEAVHRDPGGRSWRIAQATRTRAAFAAGALALPPGPLGWLTLLPELRTVWQQQGQMVADIASAHGRHGELSREVMLYCLFRHIAPGAFATVVRHDGPRIVIGRASPAVLRAIAFKIAARITLRLLGRGATRWLPVVGAVGVGAFSWYDTGKVAATARQVFALPFESVGPGPSPG